MSIVSILASHVGQMIAIQFFRQYCIAFFRQKIVLMQQLMTGRIRISP